MSQTTHLYRLEVRAENEEEARKLLQGRDLATAWIAEVDEPTNYRREIEAMAEDLVDNYWSDDEYGVWRILAEEKLADGISTADTVYDDLYQLADPDITDACHEWLDGSQIAIYMSPSDSLEACKQLYEWEEDDSGLWEGEDAEKAITSRGFWTMRNALCAMVEDEIKTRLEAMVEDRDDTEEA